MPQLVAAEERFSFQGDQRSAFSSANCRFTDYLEASIVQTGSTKGFTVCFRGRGWRLAHNTVTQATEGEWKGAVGSSTLQILQLIPQNNFYLMGTPSFKVVHKLKGTEHCDRLEAVFDNLARRSQISTYAYFGALRKHKIQWHIDSLAGPTVACRSKVHAGPLRSLAAVFNAATGVQLQCKPRHVGSAKAILAANLTSAHVSGTVKYTLPSREGARWGRQGKTALCLQLAHAVYGKQAPAVNMKVEWAA
ncbi:hypothetical protein WJX73_007220 [Symbiochloris irregularis]|uniref:Uncharacterized protein n=1 Tax=Symbiochloris irregularis TaxID=706552 RepID=A0AAW1NY75_9CHLO